MMKKIKDILASALSIAIVICFAVMLWFFTEILLAIVVAIVILSVGAVAAALLYIYIRAAMNKKVKK